MGADERDQRIVEDLFFEQDVDVLAVSYKHGVLRSILVLARSLLFSRKSDRPVDEAIVSGASVAVVFFQNEFQAISNAPARVRVDHLLRLDLHALALVRGQLGWLGLWRETVHFARLALTLKGWHRIGRFSYPLLGWLLYRTFQSLLVGKSDVTLITTNMQHPVSLGVVWAAVSMQQATDFYEHATTPRVVARDRGYRNVYVNFEHTRQMLVEQGFGPERVHVLQRIETGPARPGGSPIRKVGICINFFDSLEAIADITDVLREHSLDVSYRVHDADPRLPQLKRIAERQNAALSDARQSGIGAFLGTVDLIVSGNSNVIADALMAGRRVVYYWSGAPDMFDYYGLVSHYKLPHASSKSSLRAVVGELLVGVAQC